MRRMPLAALLMMALVLGVLVFAHWYERRYPREIIRTGTVQVRSQRPGGGVATHKTRDVSVNGVVFQEVALPSGSWIDCAGDCERAAREAGEAFWERQDGNRR